MCRKSSFGWPIGMPYCRSLGNGLWEVRSDLTDGKIGRVIFCVVRDHMVLVHGFVKKTRKTPAKDIGTGSQTHEGSGVEKHGTEEERENRLIFRWLPGRGRHSADV